MKKTLLLVLGAALFCAVCFWAGSACGGISARKNTESSIPPGPGDFASAAKRYAGYPVGSPQFPHQTVSPADRKALKSGGPSVKRQFSSGGYSVTRQFAQDKMLSNLAAGFPCKIFPDSDYAEDLELTPKQKKLLEKLNKRYFTLFEAEYKRELGVYMTRITGPHPMKEHVKLESGGKSEALGAGYEKEFRSFLTKEQLVRCRPTAEADMLGYDLNHHFNIYPKPHDICFFRTFGLTDGQTKKIERLNAEYGDSLGKSRSPAERLRSEQGYKTQ
ncbi:MAG: hypothetical protein J5758_07570, partial [Abditibacteriota bacterium]|nr:hypothetical protein [Abditibacteriota bacterium]